MLADKISEFDDLHYLSALKSGDFDDMHFLLALKEDDFDNLHCLLAPKTDDFSSFHNYTFPQEDAFKRLYHLSVYTIVSVSDFPIHRFTNLPDSGNPVAFSAFPCAKVLFSEQYLSENSSDYVIFACSKQRSKNNFRSD